MGALVNWGRCCQIDLVVHLECVNNPPRMQQWGILVTRQNPKLHFAPFLSTHFFPCSNGQWPALAKQIWAKPTLANFCVLVFLTQFSQPINKPNPTKTQKPTFGPEPQTLQTQTLNLREKGPDPFSGAHPSGQFRRPFAPPVLGTIVLGLACTLHFWRCWCCCGGCCWSGLSGPPCGRPPDAGPPHKISLFFFPSPAPILFFFCLSGCLLVEFWRFF